jgi:hypothetical protein
VIDQDPCLYRTTGELIVLCIVIFTFLDKRGEINDNEPSGSKHYPNNIFLVEICQNAVNSKQQITAAVITVTQKMG